MKQQKQSVSKCIDCKYGLRRIGQAVYCSLHLTYTKAEDGACSFGGQS